MANTRDVEKDCMGTYYCINFLHELPSMRYNAPPRSHRPPNIKPSAPGTGVGRPEISPKQCRLLPIVLVSH